MLSGPKDASVSTDPSGSSTDANGVKTYTIDLTAPKPSVVGPTASQAVIEPPPVQLAAAPAEPAQELAQSVHEKEKPARVEPVAEKSLPEKPAVEKNAGEKTRLPAAAASAPVVKAAIDQDVVEKKIGKGSWAVQVASFGARATSERIASELKAAGYVAFVTSFAVKGQTMYRVRVGPVEDRAAAEALLKKLKPLHPGAAVVSQ